MILRQGKQIITMNFTHFIWALPILGGKGCMTTFAWMVLGKLVNNNFPKGDATKKGPNKKLYFWEKSTFLSNTFSMASVGLEKKSITRRGSSISLENKKSLFRKDFSSWNSFRFIWSCHCFFHSSRGPLTLLWKPNGNCVSLVAFICFLVSALALTTLKTGGNCLFWNG